MRLVMPFLIVFFISACGNESKFKIKDTVEISVDGQVGKIVDVDCHSLLFEKSEDVCKYTVVVPVIGGGYENYKFEEKFLAKTNN